MTRTPVGGDYGALRRLYANYAPRYDRQFARYTAATLGRAIAAIDAPPRSLVDVACGTGVLAEHVRKRWPATSIIGVDLSREMLDQAARRMPPTGERTARGGRDERAAYNDGAAVAATTTTAITDWRIGPAEKLPVDNAFADTLTCTNAFHLVQDPDAALAEFRRVLAPGGRLVLVDWSRDFISMRGLLATLTLVRRQKRRAWSLDELAGAVERAGFAVELRERFKVGPVWGLMTIRGRRR